MHYSVYIHTTSPMATRIEVRSTLCQPIVGGRGAIDGFPNPEPTPHENMMVKALDLQATLSSTGASHELVSVVLIPDYSSPLDERKLEKFIEDLELALQQAKQDV